MKHLLSWFEIPVIDYDRAERFYETILGYEIDKQTMGDSIMGMFPFEDFNVGGALVKDKNYQPSLTGVLVYFHAEDVADVLAKVEDAGGKIAVPKTKISDEHGFFGLITDTEGNNIGIHSMK